MRIRHCNRCGKSYQSKSREWWVYRCPECSEASHRENYIRPRSCTVCGQVFDGTPAAKYCPSCRADKKRERDAGSRGRKTRALGSTDICVRCGESYTVTGPNQKRCPACAEAGAKEAKKQHAKGYRQAHKEQIAAYAAAMRQDSKVCVVCGAVFGGRGPAVTCSEACAKEQLRRRKRRAREKKR